jgi:hypothetical protein
MLAVSRSTRTSISNVQSCRQAQSQHLRQVRFTSTESIALNQQSAGKKLRVAIIGAGVGGMRAFCLCLVCFVAWYLLMSVIRTDHCSSFSPKRTLRFVLSHTPFPDAREPLLAHDKQPHTTTLVCTSLTSSLLCPVKVFERFSALCPPLGAGYALTNGTHLWTASKS